MLLIIQIRASMSNNKRSFYLTCWNCKRKNIPYVFKSAEDTPPAKTTVQVPCPFCQKMMAVEIPFDLPPDATAIKQLSTKKA